MKLHNILTTNVAFFFISLLWMFQFFVTSVQADTIYYTTTIIDGSRGRWQNLTNAIGNPDGNYASFESTTANTPLFYANFPFIPIQNSMQLTSITIQVYGYVIENNPIVIGIGNCSTSLSLPSTAGDSYTHTFQIPEVNACLTQNMLVSSDRLFRFTWYYGQPTEAYVDAIGITPHYTPLPTPPVIVSPTPTSTPAPIPKTPVVFIPGIMGSEMEVKESFDPMISNCLKPSIRFTYHINDVVWFDDTKLFNTYIPCESAYLEVLKLKDDGITGIYSQIELGTGITSGNVSGGNVGYIETMPYLQSKGYTLGKDLFIFPYDWRKDINLTAPLFDAKISEIISKTGHQKVNIIAHSMGGLVSRNYIKSPEHAAKVDTLITLGTPHAGSVDALANLLYPVCVKALDLLCTISGKQINALIQNYPSAFELLPSSLYYELYQTSSVFRDGRDMDNDGTTGLLNKENIKTLFSNLNKNMPLYEKAEAFHNELDQTYDNTNGVKVYMIAGTGKATASQLIDYVSNNNIIKHDAVATNGDGTVPFKSATLGKNQNVYYVKQSHGALVGNGPGMEMTVNLLEGKTALISGVQTVPFSFTGKIISVHSPADLHAYDRLGNHTGEKEDGSYEESIPGSSYSEIADTKFIYLPEEATQDYTIKTEATDVGPFDLKVKTYEDSEYKKVQIFSDVQQTIETKSEMILDTETPILNVDENNDGIADKTLSPTYVLEDENVHAYAPPQTTLQTNIPATHEYPSTSSVIVTLIATPSAGFNVMHTYYTINSGTPQEYSLPFTLSSIGTYTITYWSEDNAGLIEPQQTKTIRIVYLFKGFAWPIKNLPAFNAVKNSIKYIPLPFSIGGYKGKNILQEAPKSTQITCPINSPQELGTDPLHTSATGGLIYNPFTHNYMYFLKTDRNWKNTCRKFTMKLIDSTEHIVQFYFK